MSKITNSKLWMDFLPRPDGPVSNNKYKIEMVYTMAYTEDICKLFMRLETSAITLALYVGSLYGDNEDFPYNIVFVEKFNNHLKNNGCPEYHRTTVDKAMNTLREYGFVLKLHKGLYAVSPKFLYRGEPTLRVSTLQVLLDRAMKYEPIDIQKHNEITK